MRCDGRLEICTCGDCGSPHGALKKWNADVSRQRCVSEVRANAMLAGFCQLKPEFRVILESVVGSPAATFLNWTASGTGT